MINNSITYKEHVNTGNYCWKEFERTVVILEGEDAEEKSLELIEFVQRIIGHNQTQEELHRQTERVAELKDERKNLLKEIRQLREKYESDSLKPQDESTEVESDDIPFDPDKF